METAHQGFPVTIPVALADRLSASSTPFRRRHVPLTDDERELVALHLDGMAARVRAGLVLEADVDGDFDFDNNTRAKTIRVVIPE